MKLENKSAAEVYSKTDWSELFPGKARMIQLIKDTYPIVKDEIVKYIARQKDTNKVNFYKFFTDYAIALNQIKGNRTSLDISYSDYYEKYQAAVHVFFNYRSQCLYYISVSFLPELKVKDKLMHDIIVECLRIIASTGVDVFETFLDEEDMVSDLILEEHCGQYLIEERDLYLNHSIEYKEMISKVPDINKLKRYLNKLDSNEFSFKLIMWANKVIDLYDEKYGMDDIVGESKRLAAEIEGCEIEDLFENGHPVELDMTMRILWYQSVEYIENLTSYLGDIAGNFDTIEYHNIYQCNTSEEFNNVENRLISEVGLYPEKLAGILEESSYIVSDLRDKYKIPENGNPFERL